MQQLNIEDLYGANREFKKNARRTVMVGGPSILMLVSMGFYHPSPACRNANHSTEAVHIVHLFYHSLPRSQFGNSPAVPNLAGNVPASDREVIDGESDQLEARAHYVRRTMKVTHRCAINMARATKCNPTNIPANGTFSTAVVATLRHQCPNRFPVGTAPTHTARALTADSWN
jgi:hypothetical protein